MIKFSQILKENVDGKTEILFKRIKNQLQEIYETEANFLKEKLTEFGFEVEDYKILIKDGYKTKAGITIYFKFNDIEYALVDEFMSQEFSLYTSTNNIKKINNLIEKGFTFEQTIKSLREYLNNKKILYVYFENTETGVGREEKIDASEIFDKNRNLNIVEICKELGKKIKKHYKNDDLLFITKIFVVKGKEYKMIGDAEYFSINDGDDDIAKDENGKEYPSYRL